jgi:hypothetical protein
MEGAAERQRLALEIFVDHRVRSELLLAGAVTASAAGAVMAVGISDYEDALVAATRSNLFLSLAGTSAALLGFVLAALAILIALPSGERLSALQRNRNWQRLPDTFLRASRALLLALLVCTACVAVDSAKEPRWWLEAPALAVVVVALVRVFACAVVLESLVGVVVADRTGRQRVLDP